MMAGSLPEQVGGYLKRRRRRKWSAPIALNMTAMIDVVFLLLVYFMLVAQFGGGTAVIGMEMRGEGAGERDPFALPRRVVRVAVHSRSAAPGDYTVSADAGEHIGVNELITRLEEAGGAPVSIEPDDSAIWEHALDAYQSLRHAGLTNTHIGVGAE